MNRLAQLSIGLSFAVFSVTTLAGPECTKTPKERWMSEKDMRSKIEAQGYKIKVFKTTSGNCYEIYGKDKDGKKVEIYYNPVDGSVVKQR